MRILFTKRTIYEIRGPRDGEVFEVGQIVDLREDLARRWLSRGVAELAPEEAPEPIKPPVDTPAPPKADETGRDTTSPGSTEGPGDTTDEAQATTPEPVSTLAQDPGAAPAEPGAERSPAELSAGKTGATTQDAVNPPKPKSPRGPRSAKKAD